MSFSKDHHSDVATARAALAALSPSRADDRDDWLSVGMCLHSVGDELQPDWKAWSQRSEKYRPRDCRKQWRSFKRGRPGDRGLGTLIEMADTDSPGWWQRLPERPLPHPTQRHRPATSPAPQKPCKPSRTWATCKEAVKVMEASMGKHTKFWTYLDCEWQPVGASVRWDLPDGEKTFRPFARTADGRWRLGAMDEPRPIYRLPDIRELGADDPVVVVEGEKCAIAVSGIGVEATTSSGGASAARKTDWSPLAGRDVAIFADNDADGRKYARTVTAILQVLNPPARVRIIELPDLEAKEDVANFIDARRDDGADDDTIRGELQTLIDQTDPEAAPVAQVEPTWKPDTHKAESRPLSTPVLTCLADVEPEEMSWLWPGRIPLGKLTLYAGDPGLGKSLTTLDMAARVSTGRPWPDSPSASNPVGGVVLLNAEDDKADTIRPRLDAAEADVSRIFIIESVKHFGIGAYSDTESTFCLTTDLQALEQAIRKTDDCKLVVIDPITAYLGGTDSHKNAELRGLLAPLSATAAEHGVAVVAVTHLNKNTGGPAIYRSMGSVAFTAAARAVWAVTKDKDDASRRLVLPVKCNLGPDVMGMAYRIESSESTGAPIVLWDSEPVSVSVDDAMAAEYSGSGDRTDREQAADWLRTALADGPMYSTQVFEQGRENGHSDKTIRRAFKDMGGKPSKSGFDGGWFWELPREDAQVAEDAQPPDVGTLGDGGHLGGDDSADDDWEEI